MRQHANTVLLAAGTLLIGVGGSGAVMAAFHGLFPVTVAGIFLFIIGYKLSWSAFHPAARLTVFDGSGRFRDRAALRDGLLLLLGATGIAAGISAFAAAASSGRFLLGFGAGAVAFAGYILTHLQVEGVLV